MRLILACLFLSFLASCKEPQKPDLWEGMPDDVKRTCAWSETRTVHDTHGTCIAGGRAFQCVLVAGNPRRIACAVVTPIQPAEMPK